VGPAVVFYAGLGLFGVALAAWFVLSLAESFAAGYCELAGGFVCGDFIAPSVAGFGGLALLLTARRLRRNVPRVDTITAIGAAVGVLITAVPFVPIVIAATDDGTFNVFGSKIPVLNLIAIFVWPLLWALTSAATVWIEAVRQRQLPIHLGVAAGLTVAAVLGVSALLTGASNAHEQDADLRPSLGTATLRLEGSVEAVETDEVSCVFAPDGSVQVYLDGTRDEPRPGEPVYGAIVSIGARMGIGLHPRDDGLEVIIEVMYADRHPDEIGSTPESLLALEQDGAAAGTIQFSGLARRTFGDDGPGTEPSDVTGSFEWTCDEV
jgi:hypothetical protein